MKQKILVVDDEQDFLELIVTFLESKGFETVVAHDHIEFAEKALREKPDLIILDIMLGDHNGVQVYDELIQQGLDPAIPVIFLSGLLQNFAPFLSSRKNRISLLGKPFKHPELMQEIASHLEK